MIHRLSFSLWVYSTRNERPQRDVRSLAFHLTFEPTLVVPDFANPEQSPLPMIARPDIRESQSLLGLGYKYVERAFSSTSGTLGARIVIQPSILPNPELRRLRIIVETNGISTEHQYETEWFGECRIDSTQYMINLQIRTYHDLDDLDPQDMNSEAPSHEFGQEHEYGRLLRNHLDFRPHLTIYKPMLRATHQNLQSLGSYSCFLAYTASEPGSRLRNVICQAWPGSEDQVGHITKTKIHGWTGDNPPVERRNPGPSFTVAMDRKDYDSLRSATEERPPQMSDLHKAYVALGSNIGDRIAMIEAACQAMSQRGMTIIRTSALYETEPMYVKAQESFVNGICEASAPLRLHKYKGSLPVRLDRLKQF